MEKRQHHIAGDRRAKDNTPPKKSAPFARVIKQYLFINWTNVLQTIRLIIINSQILVVSLLSLSIVTACSAQTVKYTPPSEELVAKIKATHWLSNMENGGTTCAYGGMSIRDRQDCVWVESSLLPPLDMTKRQHFGQRYDPKKYYQCRMEDPYIGDCDIYKLRRKEQPPVWPYADVSAMKWPVAPEKSTYQRGMTSKEYFDALCEAEAGKFIYRTVDNVKGIYQVRPRLSQRGDESKDRYVLEDPAFQIIVKYENENIGANFIGKSGSGRYSYWETSLYERERPPSDLKYYHPSVLLKPPTDAKFIRYAVAIGDDYDSMRVYNITKTYETQLKSRYGYVWRGIQRPYDRENSVAGGEIAVVDLQTNEILGLWRSFARTGNNDHQIWWLGGETCYERTGKNDFYQFITTVLKPGK